MIVVDEEELTMERCACGFVWSEVAIDTVASRLHASTAALAELLRNGGDRAGRRPHHDVWSPIEYVAHVRDVLLHMRDRIVIALVEDNPTFKPLYREERVALGLYSTERVDTLVNELPVAASLLVRLVPRLDAKQLNRPCQYAYPTLATRSVLWMTQQALHEAEHHTRDVELMLARSR